MMMPDALKTAPSKTLSFIFSETIFNHLHCFVGTTLFLTEPLPNFKFPVSTSAFNSIIHAFSKKV